MARSDSHLKITLGMEKKWLVDWGGKTKRCLLLLNGEEVMLTYQGVSGLDHSLRPPGDKVWCSSSEFSPSCLLYYIHLRLLNCLFSLGYKVKTSCLSSVSLYAQLLVHCQTLKRLSVFI